MPMTFDPIFAVDPNNPSMVASNASVTIFDPADAGKAPIAITDPTGVPLPNPITVNKNGYGSAFQHPTLERVGWHGGGFTGYFTSYEGMKAEATTAKTAAETAATNAGAAATADIAARIAAGQFKGDKGADGSNVLPTDTAIANAINTNGTATKTALSATILAQVDPVQVALAKMKKDANALSTFWSAVRGAGSAPVDILAIGDSVVEGSGATAVTERWIDELVKYLRTYYQPTGVTGGAGYIPAHYGGTIPGAFTVAGAPGTSVAGGLGFRRYLLNAAGQSLTITRTCTSFDVFFRYESGVKFTVTIDGGTPVVVAPSSGSGYGVKWSSSALTAGSHTIVIGHEATSAVAAGIEGVMFYNGDETKGIRLWDSARHGYTSGNFSGNFNYRAMFSQATGPVPDLIMIALGYNDMRTNIAPATYKTNIQSIIAKLREARPRTPVLLVADPAMAQESFAYPWSDYLTAMQEIAAADVFTTLLDLNPLVPANWWSATYLADGLHPNDAGYQIMGDLAGSHLLPR